MRDIDKIFAELNNLNYPKNKSERRVLSNYLNEATDIKPVTFFVGSCPDYSHSGGLYTHESVGEGVPLLTQSHLENSRELLELMKKMGVPYKAIIMVADVEAIDEVFANRFTGGNRSEFLRLCHSSVNATENFIRRLGIGGIVESSSFFMEFGFEKFMEYQDKYSGVLKQRYINDSSFRTRVDTDIYSRSQMYKKMYPDSLINRLSENDREGFLVGRDIRTKAQYLTLGRLISERDDVLPVIINHPTKNLGMFNDRNKFLLQEDGVRPQPTVPVFEMKKKVY